ncbi:sigma-70 family RNA polymerase sigma factor [Alkalihalobacillus sp. AL-G]|uniref:sigma-70 family RNA polymerase sigma factor n=1 Tax=Alkalihalobacillus sp. AL-G TaxID=2926399 RepID=UPI00272C4937|nr:sigma-70 family RNA polymerase sigma factor [Alkalihalobacillus sp. AL-G]WLD93227.1 sigma-70 family RNA polymerase sigma factor [Alkalihalobacillus sp. AL-G]
MTKTKQRLFNEIAGQQDFLSAFLQCPENKREMMKLIENPAMEQFKRIDVQFRAFCFECRFVHYVSRMIYFQAINYIRKQRRGQSRILDDQPVEMEQVGIWMNSALDQNQIACPTLFEAINGLTTNQKKIVELYYQEGWKLKEIANHLRVSPQSISKTHRRALEQLQLRMEGNKYA